MAWYFVEDGERIGPLEDDNFADYVKGGRITAETLVWREGMADWAPYSQVRAQAAAVQPEPFSDTEAATAATAACAECGRQVAADEVIYLSGVPICAECKPLAVQKMREGVGIRGTVEYGGFWIRFAAKFIDGIILWGINAVVTVFMGLLTGAVGAAGMQTRSFMAGSLLQIIVAAAYTTFFLGKFAATPGKMACRLRVIDADGGSISYVRAFARHLAEFLSSIIFMIGYIMAAFDEEKRTLHDRICNTRVIKS